MATDGVQGLFGTLIGAVSLAAAVALVLEHPEELQAVAAAAIGGESSSARVSRPEEPESSSRPANAGPSVALAASRSGHYHTPIEINGRTISAMVDTGATMVALSWEDAERAGLSLGRRDFTQSVSTANGVARVAPVTLSRVSIGDITLRNVVAVVSERGRLQTSLLGMSFLGRLSRLDMRDGTLLLIE